MQKRMNSYTTYINGILAHEIPVNSVFSLETGQTVSARKDVIPTRRDYEKILSSHLEHIQFFQHERLVLLIQAAAFLCLALLSAGGLLAAVLSGRSFLFAAAPLAALAAFGALSGVSFARYHSLSKGLHQLYLQYDRLSEQLL